MWKITRKFEAIVDGAMMIVGWRCARVRLQNYKMNAERKRTRKKIWNCGIFTQSHATCDVYLGMHRGQEPVVTNVCSVENFQQTFTFARISDDNKFGCVRAWMRSTTISKLCTHRGGSRSRFGAFYISLPRCYHLRIYAEPWHRRIIYPSSSTFNAQQTVLCLLCECCCSAV